MVTANQQHQSTENGVDWLAGDLYLSGYMSADRAWQVSVRREKLSEWSSTLWSLNAAQNVISELLTPVTPSHSQSEYNKHSTQGV